MKNAMTLIALAGIASAASAQNFSLSIGAPTQVAEGAVFTIEVTGDSDFGTHLAGGGFSLTSGSALIDNMTWTPAGWSAFNEDGGYAGNGDYGLVVFGQLLLPFPGLDTPGAGSELGGVIGSFQVTLAAAGTGTIDFGLVAGSPFTLETINIDDFTSAQDIASGATLELNGASVRVTPAPSAMALLGLGGLVAGRRRR